MTQLPCIPCGGRGSTSCTACGGAGHTFISKSRMRFDRTLEFYQDRVPCTGCFSSGRVPCVFCKGSGWVLQSGAVPPGSHAGEVADGAPGAESGGDPDAADVFEFPPYEFVRHPRHQDIWACWQHNPGNCLDIGVSPHRTVRIQVAACATDTWLAVRDGSGNPVPLTILVGAGGGLLGRWL